jgi:hypothetical protein
MHRQFGLILIAVQNTKGVYLNPESYEIQEGSVLWLVGRMRYLAAPRSNFTFGKLRKVALKLSKGKKLRRKETREKCTAESNVAD